MDHRREAARIACLRGGGRGGHVRSVPPVVLFHRTFSVTQR